MNREDSTAVLQGFIITGGKGTVWSTRRTSTTIPRRAAAFCASWPRRGSGSTTSWGTRRWSAGRTIASAGGGASARGYAEPTIANNVIRGNKGRYGAGIVLFLSAATVRNNLILENVGGEDFGGAGLWWWTT